MYFVYIFRCADESLYTGITNDIDRRLASHKAGTASKYTRSRGAVRFEYIEGKRTKGAALKREAAIKNLTRAQKLSLITQVGKKAKVR
jgi:predicted GIY-YIG superfamily endonuclease